MDYVMLKDVNMGSQNWTIKVRLVRFCEVMSILEPNKRARTDLVLLDEEGNMMEGQVPDNWHKRTGIMLKEDHVYKIRYFRVLNAKKSFRAVSRECMIQFSVYSTVDEQTSVPNNFPLYGHSALSFDVLRSRINNDIVTSDAIVILTGCSHARDQSTKKSGIRRLRNLTITNGLETIGVALWGKHADDFDAEMCMEDSTQKPVVLLLCAMNCRIFNGQLSLQNSALCRWYINPQLQEADALRASYAANAPPLVWLDAPRVAPETENKTVTELAAVNPHPTENKRFVVTAKIKEIVPEQSWWYLACNKCNKSLRESGNTYKCSDYDCTSTAGTARYRLLLRAVDPDVLVTNNEAPTIQLVFFGPTAEEIVGISVHDLINSGGGVGANLPKKIEEVYGKVVTVRVNVGRFSFSSTSGVISFVVNNIIEVSPASTGHAEVTAPTTTQVQIHENPNVLQDIPKTGSETATGTTRPQTIAAASTEPENCTPPPLDNKRANAGSEDDESNKYARSSTSARRKLNLDEPSQKE